MSSPLARLTRRKSLLVNSLRPEFDREGFTGFYVASYSDAMADKEKLDSSFDALMRLAYKANSIVFTCVAARAMPFSEARFQFQEIVAGRPGKLLTGPSLDLLSTPWTNGTTGELLWRMEQDASLAGNFYATVVGSGAGRHIRRLRPDWMTIVSGVRNDANASPFDINAEILGYIYDPITTGNKPVFLSPAAVVHYSPIPDPDAQWRGMSWLTPLIREIEADQYATQHKVKFFENGAHLSQAITYDASLTPERFKEYVKLFEENHRGSRNAYKTLHIGGGADVKAVGTELKTDFKAIQGAGETRIAAAAGVGAIIARFSEGLAGSALNQGNYAAAKRQFADMTLRPLWRTAASALAKFVDVPANCRLWYDTRDVEFLKDDRKDAAEIRQLTAITMRQLIDAGYEPASVVEAVEADDLTRLVHSGRYSVQLQPPGTDEGPLPNESVPKSVLDALKFGARNSTSDQSLIQTAHDAIAAAGAVCPPL